MSDTTPIFIMNETVRIAYGIKFESKIIDFGIFNKVLYKVIQTSNHHLSTYLNEFGFTTDQLDDEVLPVIDAAISSPNESQSLPSVTYQCILYQNNARIYKDSSNIMVFTLPVSDLKEILEGFREYLNKPPFSAYF